nr:hypothetical protein [Mammaliicoccus sp. Marseille-Q6498]
METKRISFNDEAVLNYCNIMGYHYYEEVPVQYLLSILREFSSFKPFLKRNTKLKQIKSEFEQTERIMSLENYYAELECLNEHKNQDITFYEYQLKLYKKHKVIAKISAEFSVTDK